MATSEVWVYLYPPGQTAAVLCGRLQRMDARYVFVYRSAYLADSGALPVDPVRLPLHKGPVFERGLCGALGVFRDALPDQWGRRVIAAIAGREILDDLELLRQPLGRHRVGALEFTEPGREPADPPVPEFPLEDLLAAAEVLESAEGGRPRIPVELISALAAGSSMGGARPKAVVSYRGGLWLAKFPSARDTVNVPRIEHQTLSLARACGIEVAQSRLVDIAGKEALLVRRFDRVPAGDSFVRIGYLSGLTMLGVGETESWLHSYPDLADAMRREGLDPAELFRRMVFNILAGNRDDHARNHGFLFDGKRLTMSPAFDLVAGIGDRTPAEQAMTVGSMGRAATIENALSDAARCGLARDHAAVIASDLRERISLHFAS